MLDVFVAWEAFVPDRLHICSQCRKEIPHRDTWIPAAGHFLDCTHVHDAIMQMLMSAKRSTKKEQDEIVSEVARKGHTSRTLGIYFMRNSLSICTELPARGASPFRQW